MNYRIITISILFLIGCSSYLPPSQPTTDLMKHADTIILYVDRPPEQAFQSVSKYLKNYGFDIAEMDQQARSLVTTRKPSDNQGSSIRLTVKVHDGPPTQIRISGSLKHYTLGQTEIRYPGKKDNALKSAWDEMLYIAIGMDYQKLEYSRE